MNYTRHAMCWGGPLDGQFASSKGDRLEVLEQPDLPPINEYSTTAIAPRRIVYRAQRIQVMIMGQIKQTWIIWIRPGDPDSEDRVIGGLCLVGLLSEPGSWS